MDNKIQQVWICLRNNIKHQVYSSRSYIEVSKLATGIASLLGSTTAFRKRFIQSSEADVAGYAGLRWWILRSWYWLRKPFWSPCAEHDWGRIAVEGLSCAAWSGDLPDGFAETRFKTGATLALRFGTSTLVRNQTLEDHALWMKEATSLGCSYRPANVYDFTGHFIQALANFEA